MLSRVGMEPSILMYHSIVSNSDDPWAVPPNKFQDQLSWLLDHGFEAIPLAEMINLLKSGSCQDLKRKVVFTFDDGCIDFLTTALPILLRYKIPATVFIVAGMLGEKASWSDASKHVPLMAEHEIRRIRTQGIVLGSHTMTHVDLTSLNREELYWQLVESRARLLDLGESFYALSYPWGRWSKSVLGVVKEVGYECAVTVGGGIGPAITDIYCLPRKTIRGDMALRSFQALFDRPLVKRVCKLGCFAKKCFS